MVINSGRFFFFFFFFGGGGVRKGEGGGGLSFQKAFSRLHYGNGQYMRILCPVLLVIKGAEKVDMDLFINGGNQRKLG